MHRRLPRRFYFGLPPKDDRIRIFKTCLKDERLDAEVKMEMLGGTSWGLSGSDIKAICVEAASICDTYSRDDERKRLLNRTHFEKAFQECSSTVSRASLAEIKVFARDFDPAALKKMTQVDNVDNETEVIPNSRDDTSESSLPDGSTHDVRAQNTDARSRSSDPIIDVSEGNFQKAGEEINSKTSSSVKGDTEKLFEYTALEPDSNQIRVLSIEPLMSSDTADDMLIQCTLRLVDLNDWTHIYQTWRSTRRKCHQTHDNLVTAKSYLGACYGRSNLPDLGYDW